MKEFKKGIASALNLCVICESIRISVICKKRIMLKTEIVNNIICQKRRHFPKNI